MVKTKSPDGPDGSIVIHRDGYTITPEGVRKDGILTADKSVLRSQAQQHNPPTASTSAPSTDAKKRSNIKITRRPPSSALNGDDPTIHQTSDLQFDFLPIPPPLDMDLNADDGQQAKQQSSIPLSSNLHWSANRDDEVDIGDNFLNASGEQLSTVPDVQGLQLYIPPNNSKSKNRRSRKGGKTPADGAS